ncbi:MAG: 30S ribosomal protein S2 [Planctomycetota bacterium]|nr:30S ribosomal protein S2 [Planctomycetota bacterium]
MSLVNELVESGIHFGQRRSSWNPRMAPYIHGVKNQIHIIDVKETIKGILLAKKFLSQLTAQNKDVLFVGTKRQARGAIETHCAEAEMPFVTERWLGGTLTNFRTIRERLRRLEELDELISSGKMKTNFSKKMEAQLTREHSKIFRNLNGIRAMGKLPGAMVVVDVGRELNALKEAKVLGIPTICLIDTDGNPDFADIPIPGNDDSMRAIDVVIRELCASIKEGMESRPVSKEGPAQADADHDASDGDPSAPRRRSSRSRFRMDDAAGHSVAAGSAPAAEPVAAGSAPAAEPVAATVPTGEPVPAEGAASA